jgi:predicted amidohydrolase
MTKAALAQIAPHLADVDRNLALHEEACARARGEGASLVVFPELSLTGYLLMEATTEVAVGLDAAPLARLRELSRDVALVAGFVEEAPGGRFFNSAAFFEAGELRHVHRKVYLPSHGLFDEARHFAMGERIRAFDTAFGRVGMLVCRDFWHLGPAYVLGCQDVDVLIAVSASPGRGVSGEQGRFESAASMPLLGEVYARSFGCHVLHVNRAGLEEGVTFAGASEAFGPDGASLGRCADEDPDLVVVDLDADARRSARLRMPLVRAMRPNLIQRELTRALAERAAPRF